MLTVMEYLQKECDYESKQIFEEFRKNREFNRKVQLVSSFMNQKSDTKINPKELDLVLSEMTLLNARTELYSRFVRRRVMVRKTCIPICIMFNFCCFPFRLFS